MGISSNKIRRCSSVSETSSDWSRKNLGGRCRRYVPTMVASTLTRLIVSYLSSRGIKFEPSAPYTPEQNGISERDNRTIVECAGTMLRAKSLPTFLWAEAVNTAVYLQNRVLISDRRGKKTPYEIRTGEKPELSHTRVFGSEAFVHVPKQFTRKFDARSKKVLFVGYEGDSANYRVFNSETKAVTVSRNVVFNEKRSEVKPSHRGSERNGEKAVKNTQN